ncbi:cation:proton antiporter [Chitinophaga pendula]|uniref:cation:proton antiporter domain-containing protein n=1 Tax=Chitinophaga TaxID=79328 RepID=UPI000BAECE9A|nr:MULTISPECIES: cation:proton antiporter [Chitinophaga]ASZ10943.1 cation/H(+) antiporter [Chitinophaga sp. MD30]UCJ06069.1 cation:proton antiporter [Chitinophaga pendula]
MNRRILLYLLIIGVFGGLSWWIIREGQHLPFKALVPPSHATLLGGSFNWRQLFDNVKHPLSILLIQVIVIMLASRFFSWLAGTIRQPAVVGEVVAGICLGPSLLGWLAPDVFAFLFPSQGLSSLQFLSQIGLTFFMFVIGMELDTHQVKTKAHDAIMISHVSIVFPFFLGITLSYFLFNRFAPANVSFLSFSLFMGIAMSITAFPVLARIVQERKLGGTPLGILAITCAAADDVTAWCILAVVVAIVKASGLWSAAVTIVLALVFVVAMIKWVKPWLQRTEQRLSAKGGDKAVISLIFLVLLASACVAEIIGIHALFGAFLAGVIMPDKVEIKHKLTDKVEDISVLVLLPIFFAFTGLRTHIGLLSQGHLWTVFGLVMLVAVGGKLGGSTITAKLVGQNWTDALAIGALMNTRGLMELIVLNIGYDLGILSPEIFAILVLMAIATTFMTGPLLDLVDRLGSAQMSHSRSSL